MNTPAPSVDQITDLEKAIDSLVENKKNSQFEIGKVIAQVDSIVTETRNLLQQTSRPEEQEDSNETQRLTATFARKWNASISEAITQRIIQPLAMAKRLLATRKCELQQQQMENMDLM